MAKSNDKSLVIVESAAKAKTINKFLGRKYVVRASFGHVRDLPKKEMGIDIEKGFKPKYVVIRGRGKTLSELKSEAKKSEKVFLAPDCDREGEAIAWHLTEYLGIPEDKVYRVTFNEITEKAIKKAFEKPGNISMDKVNAQQARRILDRIVGYELSPLLWKKFWRGLSAGRVQSVAVKLIAQREKDIQAFKPEEYWQIEADVHPETDKDGFFTVELKKIDGEDFRIPNEEEAKKAVGEIESSTPKISSLEKKERLDKAPPPFQTSTMQAAASTNLRFSASKTMVIAQQLYEGIDVGEEGPTGLITYMRTDSLNLSTEAVAEARKFIETRYGREYLPDKPNTYKSKKSAQEAHEAIRPTSLEYPPEKVEKYLSPDQAKLYGLIWNRFVACQMAPAVFDVTTIDVEAGKYLLRATGRITKFKGHLLVTGVGNKKEDLEFPEVAEGDMVVFKEVRPSQHFTKPPDRYTEASLVRMLEKEGIGRPSTYAPIISTIRQRKYVELKKRRFHATELGMLVTDKLVEHFPKIMDTEFTAHMEEELDEVEEGKMDHVKVLDEFYNLFGESLKKAADEMKGINEDPEVVEGVTCEKCGSPMVYKYNKRGKFMGCSKYPDCKNTMSVDAEERVPDVETEEKCEKCNSPMVIRTGRFGKFLACSAYPKCKNTRSITEDGEIEPPVEIDEKCEKCGADMVVKKGRMGQFLACSAYPKCKNTKEMPGAEKEVKPEEIDEKCPNCGSEMVIKSGRHGKFLACSAYPECKTTKPLPGKSKEPPKETGVNCDKCGKPMVVRVGRGGTRFAACSGFPKCRNTMPISNNGDVMEEEVMEKCEKCGAEMVVKHGSRGKFLACSGYPKCKNTKSMPTSQ